MRHPIISEYADSIRFAKYNLDKLNYLRPELDGNGNPVMLVGDHGVVFKMKDITTGRLFAVKCFMDEQEGREERYARISEVLERVSSPYILHVRYLERELLVPDSCRTEERYPVLVMNWVEGQTLNAYIEQSIGGVYALQMLAYRFSMMAAWLLSQPFAHGDLSADNILVRNDGSLVLVDYDGMFVPSMGGERATEIGSPDFRHPSRTVRDFDKHIDDFSIATIALSLKAISLQPRLYGRYADVGRLLFSADDYQDISKSSVLQKIIHFVSDSEFYTILSAFLRMITNRSSDGIPCSMPILNEPVQSVVANFSTEPTKEEFAEAIEDEYGAEYTKDGLKLLGCPEGVASYKVKEGTREISDGAFAGYKDIITVTIPDSVTQICDGVFSGCSSLKSVLISNSRLYVQDDMLLSVDGRLISCWSKAEEVFIPDEVTIIGDMAFRGCDSIRSIHLPEGVVSIGEKAFRKCESLQVINLPESVVNIGDSAFPDCKSLQSIHLPSGVKTIGWGAFDSCKSLLAVDIPDGMICIGCSAFSGCTSLRSVTIPDSVVVIGDGVFNGCHSLDSVHISGNRFYMQEDLLCSAKGHLISCWSKAKEIFIPKEVTSIGPRVFFRNMDLRAVHLPEGLTSIGSMTFAFCRSLQSITIPNGVRAIKEWTFEGCTSLRSVFLPDGLRIIGMAAFSGCKSLLSIHIPDNVEKIGRNAFQDCTSLQSICVPKGTKDKYLRMLGEGFENKLGEI